MNPRCMAGFSSLLGPSSGVYRRLGRIRSHGIRYVFKQIRAIHV